ncbi:MULTISPECIES: molecular chaperone [unclassified Oceanobacter]|uniref:molecular chaperone n=1 Tax=unclassified Oceanobacter TaxID=2620260 RepID=UPI0027355D32|nr:MULTISPECIES: molecular chaperone [unclassified Oceanobacter]MDP2608629.1 molecular chaperone [Oceanobacter sp. 1_MG-2023]MDP2611609.1 molecular chaperone [Oceanobacter sp. 2_MG-2023]
MICGFDYGTSNCAMGVKSQDAVQLLAVDGDQCFMPSALYTLGRELICEQVGLAMTEGPQRDDFIKTRRGPLQLAQRARRELDLGTASEDTDAVMQVGQQAFAHYFADPEEGYFVKSPKSYLGASGLRPEFVHFFEDIVTAMMQTVKQRAELSLGQTLTHTVIGRPVNFQGVNAEHSNRQALDILSIAAKRSGFQSVEFLYEPIAAGLSFERHLTGNQTVLVVDIGGGTSDCAMVRMGPDHRDRDDRSADFLGHTGERIGGNDLDITLAGRQLMPLFGMNASLKSGKPMPTKTFLDAVCTNDVGALSRFSSLETTLHLQQLQRDCLQPELISRLLHLQTNKQNQQLVRCAENAKIALSDTDSTRVALDFVEAGLDTQVSRSGLENAIQRPLQRISELMAEAVAQAGVQPDQVFITGGSARSPIIRQAVARTLGDIPLLDGDHFGSVVSGLTEWAQRIYR